MEINESGQTILKRVSEMDEIEDLLEEYAVGSLYNAVLGLDPPLEDYQGDVEIITHPKADLKRLYPGFREVDDGGRILDLKVLPLKPHHPSRRHLCQGEH